MHYDRCCPDGTLNLVTKELVVGGLYHPAAFSALEIQSERYKIRKITPPNPSANCSTVEDEEAGDDSDEEAPELVMSLFKIHHSVANNKIIFTGFS